MIERKQFFIDGEWRDPAGSGMIDVIDAGNESVIGRAPAGNAKDIDAAVKAARKAFPKWSQSPVEERAKILDALAAALKARGKEIGEIISREVGMPLKLAERIQAGLPAAIAGINAKLVREYAFEETIGNSRVVQTSRGVVGTITPWNYPLHQLVAKVSPALAAGCTIVAKPSEEAPLSAFILADIMKEIGLPAGVFNLVSGTGPEAGQALAEHPGVDMISFTGSTGVGAKIAAIGAQTFKRVTLELGGKSPSVVLDDADFAAALKTTVGNCFLNSGQTCAATTRVLVPRGRMKEAEEQIKQVVEAIKVGDPGDPETRLGPLISAKQRERVRGYIKKGMDSGIRVLTGGPDAPAGLDKGFYVRPTVFADVPPDAVIAQEEIFGPVLCIIGYDDEAQAIEIANGTNYGLSAAVWSGDKDRAVKVARQIRAGQVDVNGANFNPLAPFGGFKQSGWGRELGAHGLAEFLEPVSIQTN